MAQNTTTTAGHYETENSGVSSTASYADILTIDARSFQRFIVTVVETGTAQSFYYKILGSIKDGTTMPASSDASFVTLVSDVSVAASGSDYQTLTGGWKWLAVQIKNNSGAATVTARAYGSL